MADTFNPSAFARARWAKEDGTLTREAQVALEILLDLAAAAGSGGSGTGTVTTVSVATANGFAGTVATATTTPTITLTTSLTGLLKGNGTAMSAAVSGTDYETVGAGAAAVVTHVGLPDPHTQYALDTDLAGYVPTTRTVNAKALNADITLNATDIGLGSVTNDAQTKAAIVPNTAPSAGQLLVGNAGGTAYAPVSSSGDVTVSSAGVFTIGAQKVTYAQFQNVTATSRVLGRRTAGAGSTEEMTISQALDFMGTTQGSVIYRDAAAFALLGPGTSGQVLKTNGGGANPAWVSTKELLANVSLGAGATSLASGTIAARRFLEIHIFISGYAGSDTASLQFNGAAGTAYRYQWATMAAAATTFTAGLTAASTDRIKVAAVNMTNSRRVVAFISNDSTVTEKLVAFRSLSGTGTAATQATRDIGDGAWVSGAATQITSVSLVSSSNMNTGTQMVIYGWN